MGSFSSFLRCDLWVCIVKIKWICHGACKNESNLKNEKENIIFDYLSTKYSQKLLENDRQKKPDSWKAETPKPDKRTRRREKSLKAVGVGYRYI